MADPKKRKLSLGEIIKKLNESATPLQSEDHTEPTGSLQSTQENANEPSSSFQIQKAPLSSRTEPTPQHMPPQKLPLQPQANTIAEPSLSPEISNSTSADIHEYDHIDSSNQKTTRPSLADRDIQNNEKISLIKTTSTPTSNSDAISNYTESSGDEEDVFDIYKYLAIVYKRKTLIFFVCILSTCYGFYSYIKCPKFYIAHARLLFSPQQTAIIDNARLPRYRFNSEEDLYTHIELLKSPALLERVSQKLGNKISTGALLGGLVIKRDINEGKDNNIINLTMRHSVAEYTQESLNELCKNYVEYRREVNAQEDTRLIFTLKTQIDKVQNELTTKENDLREFKETNKMLELSNESNLVTSQLSSIKVSFQQTQLSLLETRQKLTTLKSQISQQAVDIVQTVTYENPTQKKIADLEVQANTLAAEYNTDHYKIKQLNQQIENLKTSMHTEVQKEIEQRSTSQTLIKNPIRQSLMNTLINLTIDYSALEVKRTAQEQMIEKLELQIHKLPAIVQEYATLERETQTSIKTLLMLKSKLEEAKIIRDSKESEIKILELAQLPRKPIPTKKSSSIFLMFLVGLCIGVGIAFLLEYLDQSIKDAKTVEKQLLLPLIGIVPHIEKEHIVIKSENFTKSILEPFRTIRANLKHIQKEHNIKVFMICSAIKGEGKTTLATNLAIACSLDGKKVVLIDCDLRRSQLHQLLNIDKECGLSEYLTDQMGIDQVLKPTIYDNLKIITAGKRPPNPSELLGLHAFKELIQQLRSMADIVICDSPALIPISDSLSMVPHIDACIMVVRSQWTPLNAAKQAKNQLSRINSSIMGCILNGITHQKGYYPYYYGYYGYYGYKYSYDYDEDKAPSKWSFRHYGLVIEKKLKQHVTAIYHSLPHNLSAFQVSVVSIFRKPLFWILLAGLILIGSIRIFVLPKLHPKNQTSIAYLGLNSMQNDTIQPQVQHVTPKNTQYNELYLAFHDSIDQWMNAFNTRDFEHFIRFYDKNEFSHPSGGFQVWYDEKRLELLQENTDSYQLILDSLVATSVSNEYQQTTLFYRKATSIDTLSQKKLMIWKKLNTDWRIVAEKDVLYAH